MKYKSVWIGGIIGGISYLILILLGIYLSPSQSTQWTEVSILGQILVYIRIILLLPAFIIGFLFWGCKSPPGTFSLCTIIAVIISLIVYVLIGTLIGYVIKARKEK